VSEIPNGTICPACGEELPAGARFCGACGRPLAAPSPGMVVCPLCRTEVPEQARFCGACGQPLGTSPSAFLDPAPSMPAGMTRVPLLHGHREARVAPPVVPPPPRRDETPIGRRGTEADEGDGPRELVEEAEPTGSAPAGRFEEFAVPVDLDDEETTVRLAEADAFAARGDFERAARRLLEAHGPRPADPRVRERLAQFATELGRRAAERGRSGELGATVLRAELGRLLRLAPDRGWRDALRREIVPTLAADDVRRIHELLADGHVSAALPLAEKILSVGRGVPELHRVRHDVVAALVRAAAELERTGDEALRRGDAGRAAQCYEDALALLENDRLLLARLEQARAAPAATRGRSGARTL